jgi:hypothetical protein
MEVTKLAPVQTATQSLTSLLAMTHGPAGDSVPYIVGGRQLTGRRRGRAAWILADHAMQTRCGTAQALASWRIRRDGGPPNTGNRKRAIEVFVRMGFGLPAAPAVPDHLQGHVAELLWHRLIQERTVCTDGRELVQAPPLKADPLESGGDGLVIYKISDGTLVFRLWEVKKHESSTSTVTATIGRASRQLKTRGEEYLAKLVSPETIRHGPVAELFQDIVELWLDGSDRGGVGVSVGTSATHVASAPVSFRAVRRAFPHYSQPGQAEGILVAVPDFPAFAERVREIVWNGL